jgi:hypothetical protein
MIPQLGRRFTILLPRARLLEKPQHCAGFLFHRMHFYC